MSNWRALYLIQGRAKKVQDFRRFLPLSSTSIIISWDEPFNQTEVDWAYASTFFPNSTWAEGRNELLRIALAEFTEFDYVIFCDEDAEFEIDGLSKFEEFLKDTRPQIGFPLSDSIRTQLIYSNRIFERPIRHDQIVQAFSRSVIQDEIVLPYDVTFDRISWHLTCELNQYLIQKFYFDQSLTFNTVLVTNSHHEMINGYDRESPNESQYLGGKTRSQLRALKLYIESKYGPQSPTLDTIFQPHIFTKIRLPNLNGRHILHWRSLYHSKKIDSVKFLMKIILTFSLNSFCTKFCPNLFLNSRTGLGN